MREETTREALAMVWHAPNRQSARTGLGCQGGAEACSTEVAGQCLSGKEASGVEGCAKMQACKSGFANNLASSAGIRNVTHAKVILLGSVDVSGRKQA